MKDKLTDLIGQTEYGNHSLISENFQRKFIEKIVDHLIISGVTVLEWFPFSQPPEVWKDADGEMVNYLIHTRDYGVDIGNYFKPAKCWMCMGVPCQITHWMPLPQPPAEV